MSHDDVKLWSNNSICISIISRLSTTAFNVLRLLYRAVRRPCRAAAADNLWAPPPTTFIDRRAAAAAADNLWAPPPPTFVDRRAAADNLSARRRYHCCCVVIFGNFDDFFFKFPALWQVQTSNNSMFLDVELLL